MAFVELENDKTLVVNIDDPDFPQDLKEEIEENAFSTHLLVSKRTYHKKLPSFVKDINEAIASCPEILYNLVYINTRILNEEFPNSPEGEAELLDVIFTDGFSSDDIIDYIFEKVENNYDIDIEEGHKTVEPNSQQSILQFTNAYAKRIICTSIMCRLTFPLICSYLSFYDIKKESNIFMEAIGRIFPFFNIDDDGNDIDLATKIQKFVQVQVSNTLYSDRVIWKYLKNLAIDNNTLARDINKDLLTNIIPKLEENRSIISFFHVVIKKKIEYQFTSQFKLAYKPVTQINTNDEVNPFVRIEQKLISSSSELTCVMIKADIHKYIKANNTLSESDISYHINNISIHSSQTRILGFFLNRQLGKGIPVMSLSKKEYIQLLFIAKDWFEQNGYKYISFILIGRPDSNQSLKKK